MESSAAVCLLLDGLAEHAAECVESVLSHTPADVPIVVAGDAVVAEITGRDVLRLPGGDAAADRVAAAAQDRDVVLITAPCRVAAGWLAALAAAAATDTIVATASPLVVPPADVGDLAHAARRVTEESPRIRPRLPHPPGAPCVYVRRSAIELLGGIGERFAEDCLAAGLQHVLADDVVVEAAAAVQEDEPEPGGAVARARGAVRRLTRRLTLTIDARCLVERMTGTEVHTLELIAALRRAGSVDLRVVLPPDVGATARAVLDAMPEIERLTHADVAGSPPRTDVVHRPYQVTSAEDLTILRLLGERIVITHLDLIGYRNPAYHRDAGAWSAYRRLTRETFALADLVVFGSEHAAADALVEDLVVPERARVGGVGVDHRLLGALEPLARPRGAPDGPFLLCLGADYRHKNRLFALRLLDALAGRHGWDGALVLAGPHVPYGASREDEEEWLAGRPQLAARVRFLDAVGEGEKAWLYAEAAAVLYPSTYEGIGLIPFEAAAAGTPCLWAPVSSLAGLLAPELALLEPWDPAASADRAHVILIDDAAREAHVAAVRAAAEPLGWDRVVGPLVAVYEQAARLPDRFASRMAAAAAAADAERASWEGRYWHLFHAIGPTGLSLVGPPEPLLPQDAQRALAAVARRPATRRVLLGVLRAVRAARGANG